MKIVLNWVTDSALRTGHTTSNELNGTRRGTGCKRQPFPSYDAGLHAEFTIKGSVIPNSKGNFFKGKL